MMSDDMKGEQREYPDQHEGAVEGDRPTDRSRATPTPRRSTRRACPSDETKIAEDVLGANLDETQGTESDPAVADGPSYCLDGDVIDVARSSSDTCRTTSR